MRTDELHDDVMEVHFGLRMLDKAIAHTTLGVIMRCLATD